ncbi:MAG TPA: hypothetical protein VD968_14145 [Pyrinomonadaceae bacterium]|nr:hypothetical protein [Pyrinomonadaceae bacterium]
MRLIFIFSPVGGRESLRIDNTRLAPAEAARRIAEHYGLAGGGR